MVPAMKTITSFPRDRAEWLSFRHPNINSSEVAALFGLSPYTTEYELFYKKRVPFEYIEDEPSEWVKWGARLEPAIALGVAEDNGWSVSPMKQYIHSPEIRLGSSFDYAIGDDGILEVKNVFGMAFAKNWVKNDDGFLEAPPWIELQVQNELAVSKRNYAVIAALVGGNKIELIRREPDPHIISAIKEKTVKFWDRVEKNLPPEPDFVKDSDFICQLYSGTTPGAVLDASSMMSCANAGEIQNLAEVYRAAGEAEKDAQDQKKAAKAELLTLIGDAEKVLGDGFNISAAVVAAGRVEAYDRKEYRRFSINWKGSKK